jgi:hypothetical protein
MPRISYFYGIIGADWELAVTRKPLNPIAPLR